MLLIECNNISVLILWVKVVLISVKVFVGVVSMSMWCRLKCCVSMGLMICDKVSVYMKVIIGRLVSMVGDSYVEDVCILFVKVVKKGCSNLFDSVIRNIVSCSCVSWMLKFVLLLLILLWMWFEVVMESLFLYFLCVFLMVFDEGLCFCRLLIYY